MAPLVWVIDCATPALPCPACELDGQLTVSPLPSVHALPAAATRNFVKLFVVPEPSERCTIKMFVDGRSTPGLSDLIAASSQVVAVPWKILAIVVGLSFN